MVIRTIDDHDLGIRVAESPGGMYATKPAAYDDDARSIRDAHGSAVGRPSAARVSLGNARRLGGHQVDKESGGARNPRRQLPEERQRGVHVGPLA